MRTGLRLRTGLLRSGLLLQSEVQEGSLLQAFVLRTVVLRSDLLGACSDLCRCCPDLRRSCSHLRLRADLRLRQSLQQLLQAKVLQAEVLQSQVLQARLLLLRRSCSDLRLRPLSCNPSQPPPAAHTSAAGGAATHKSRSPRSSDRGLFAFCLKQFQISNFKFELWILKRPAPKPTTLEAAADKIRLVDLLRSFLDL